MKLDQHGCGCTHRNQALGHQPPCPKAQMSGVEKKRAKEIAEFVESLRGIVNRKRWSHL